MNIGHKLSNFAKGVVKRVRGDFSPFSNRWKQGHIGKMMRSNSIKVGNLFAITPNQLKHWSAKFRTIKRDGRLWQYGKKYPDYDFSSWSSSSMNSASRLSDLYNSEGAIN